MTKRIKILMLALMIILTSTLTVNAADAIVTLNPSETKLNPGDEFTITVSAECNSKLSGIDSNLIYDKDNLEFIKVDRVNTDWNIMDEDLSEVQDSIYDRNISAYHNETKEKDDIFIITFKVKESTTVNTIAKISLNGIVLYDVNQQSYDLGTKEVEVSIVEEQVNDNPGDNNTPGTENDGDNNNTGSGDNETNNENNQGDNNNTPGTEDNGENNNSGAGDNELNDENNQGDNNNTPETEDNGENNNSGAGDNESNNENNQGDNNNTPGSGNTGENNNGTDNKENTNDEYEQIKEEKDNTKTEEKMPDTGVSSVIGIMAIVAVFAVVCLVKYNKYKEI